MGGERAIFAQIIQLSKMLRTYEFTYPGAGLLGLEASSTGSLNGTFHQKQNNEFFTVWSVKGDSIPKK